MLVKIKNSEGVEVVKDLYITTATRLINRGLAVKVDTPEDEVKVKISKRKRNEKNI